MTCSHVREMKQDVSYEFGDFDDHRKKKKIIYHHYYYCTFSDAAFASAAFLASFRALYLL